MALVDRYRKNCVSGFVLDSPCVRGEKSGKYHVT